MFNFMTKQNNQQSNQQPNNQQQNSQQQQTANNQQTNQMLNNGNNGNPDNNQQQNNQQAKNPLDDYTNLFNNTNKEEDKAPTFTIPQDKLQDVAKQLSFASKLSPDLQKRIQAGEPAAFIEALDEVGRMIYSTNMEHMSTLSGSFIDSRLGYENNSFGSRVKEELTASELANQTNSQHPVVKQQLTALAKQLAKQYPEASPTEIASKAKDFYLALSQQINPPNQEQDPNKGSNADVDWNKYFS